MNDKSLIGKWKYEIEYYDYIDYMITSNNNRYQISMLDRNDGEKCDVSKVKWDGNILSFDSQFPSTDRLCHNVIESISDNTILRTLHYTETYSRNASDSYERNLNGYEVTKNPKYPIVGVWNGNQSDEGYGYTDEGYEYTIDQNSKGFMVHVIDDDSGEDQKVSNIVWNGKSLTFDAQLPELGANGNFEYRALSQNKIQITYTFEHMDYLIRAD